MKEPNQDHNKEARTGKDRASKNCPLHKSKEVSKTEDRRRATVRLESH